MLRGGERKRHLQRMETQKGKKREEEEKLGRKDEKLRSDRRVENREHRVYIRARQAPCRYEFSSFGERCLCVSREKRDERSGPERKRRWLKEDAIASEASWSKATRGLSMFRFVYGFYSTRFIGDWMLQMEKKNIAKSRNA